MSVFFQCNTCLYAHTYTSELQGNRCCRCGSLSISQIDDYITNNKEEGDIGDICFDEVDGEIELV